MVRFKNRYFVAEIEVNDRPPHAPFVFKKNALQSCIFSKIQQIHGDFGVSAVTNGFRIKYCNPYTKIVMIRCRHGPHRFVGTILPLIRMIDKAKAQFNILYIGGTMIKCFKFIRNYQLASLERYWNQMKSESDRIQLKEALLNGISKKSEKRKVKRIAKDFLYTQ